MTLYDGRKGKRRPKHSRPHQKWPGYFVTVSVLIMIFALADADFDLYDTEVLYVNLPLSVLFCLLGLFYYRNPFIISSLACGIYILLQVVNLARDRDMFLKGFIFKALIIYGLFKAIQFARGYQPVINKESGLLDDDL